MAVGATNRLFLKQNLSDVPLDGRIVLVRVDFNVPLDESGQIDDDFRIVASLPTLSELMARHCRVVLISHLGRPDGKVDAKLSLEPVAARLGELLGRPVAFAADCIGDIASQAVKKLGQGDVLLLQNLRFHAGEEANDPAFAAALVKGSGAAYFVQDGFGVVHRAHASTEAITHLLPSVAGLLVQKEYQVLTGAMSNPKRPLVAVLGGVKVSDKISVIERFVAVADRVVIGGAMANTFLSYQGKNIGKSIHEDDLAPTIERIYTAVRQITADVDSFIMLPTDAAVATSLDPAAVRREVLLSEVAEDDYILDLGPRSIEAAISLIESAQTVVWSGTLGRAETPQFAHGSARVALALAEHKSTVSSIIGGGDTVDFVLHWSGDGGKSFGHVSTGGSASVELMSGMKLPGIEALMDAR